MHLLSHNNEAKTEPGEFQLLEVHSSDMGPESLSLEVRYHDQYGACFDVVRELSESSQQRTMFWETSAYWLAEQLDDALQRAPWLPEGAVVSEANHEGATLKRFRDGGCEIVVGGTRRLTLTSDQRAWLVDELARDMQEPKAVRRERPTPARAKQPLATAQDVPLFQPGERIRLF